MLINITGGMDLAIDEVHQVSTIIQEEAGPEAEIIFGAVHDPTLEGRLRVTVIATGFDEMIRPDFGRRSALRSRSPRPVEQPLQVAVGGGPSPEVVPLPRLSERVATRDQIGELDIPTFIRRQMD